MKKKFLIAFVIIHAFSAMLSGCSFFSKSTFVGAEAYEQAVKDIVGSSFVATVSKSVTIDAGIDTISETSVAKMTVKNYAAADMHTEANITVTSGGHSYAAEEICTGEMSYLKINGGLFSAPYTDIGYAVRQLSPALFEPSQYENIQSRHEKGRQVIGFSQPITEHNITIPDGAQLIDSTSSAILLANGSLYESSHSIIYTYGSATVAQTVTARFDMQNNVTVSVPNNPGDYISVPDTVAPLLLETACTRLLGFSSVTSNVAYDIVCEAGGLQRIQTTTTKITDSSDGLCAQVDTEVSLINQNLHGSVDSYTQTETFSGGNYTIIPNETNEPNKDVSEEAMRSYCKNNLVSSVMLPAFISGIEISEDESSYALTFRATETLAQLLFSNAYESLYTDQASASDVVDSYETQTISGYIEISKYTGLPTVAGMEYTAAAAIEDADQRFHVRIEQEYSYGN